MHLWQPVRPRPLPARVDPQNPGGFAHIPALDGVRGLAILFVLCVHLFSSNTEANGPLFRIIGRITASGYIGVNLFFVLSGFLITGILLDTLDRPSYFKTFYARRILRIFPLYYGVLLLLLGGYPSASPELGRLGSAPVHLYLEPGRLARQPAHSAASVQYQPLLDPSGRGAVLSRVAVPGVPHPDTSPHRSIRPGWMLLRVPDSASACSLPLSLRKHLSAPTPRPSRAQTICSTDAV